MYNAKRDNRMKTKNMLRTFLMAVGLLMGTISVQAITHTITYYIDNVEYLKESLEEGTTIVPPTPPSHDHYIFKWGYYPDKMYNYDVKVYGSYTAIPTYTVKWILDWNQNDVVRTDVVYEGDPIPDAPTVTRYGYIFNGWKFNESEILPTIMPNYNITINGTTTKNLFTVTFVINNSIVATRELENGAAIILPDNIEVPEGYKVVWGNENGWYPDKVYGQDVTIEGRHVALNKYTLTYYLYNEATYQYDDVYQSYEIYETYPIQIPDDPERAGYTFSGWDYIPSTMPSQGFNVTGRFYKNYMPQSPVWQESSVTYQVPVGGTFTSGQTVDVKSESGITVATLTFGEDGGAAFRAAVESKPILDFDGFVAYTDGNGTNGNLAGGTFYTITPNYDGFIAVGVVLNKDKEFYVEENGNVLDSYKGIVSAAKYKGAYGFSVTAGKTYKIYASGSKLGFYGFKFDYSTPKYTLTYQVDGQTYHVDRLEEGAVPTLPANPNKIGYSFTGWTGVPETMPAEAVTATAEFSINIYKLTYLVDGNVEATYEYEYGASITPFEYTVESGKIFSGWNNLPTKMPASDITVEGHVLKEIQNIQATISSSTGYATFSYDEPLDFTNVTALKAYIVKQVNQSTAELVEVTGVIAAGTGLIIKGSSTTVPTSNTSLGVSPAGNLLVGVTNGSQTIMSADSYVLTEVNGVARFQATEGHQAVIPENHAYLQAPSSNARLLTIVLDNEATGLTIPTLGQGKLGVVYDLSGRQIPNPKKGSLYIIDGKKTIFK